VIVHLENYTDAAAAALTVKYGPILSIAKDSQVAVGASRVSDSAPWYGGDSIANSTFVCTSWISTISAAGAAISPTAGHCQGGTFSNAGHTFGTVTTRHFGGSMDGELIPVSSNANRVWSDPTSSNRVVNGLASSDTVGAMVCTDGQTDREVCSVSIISTNNSVAYDGQTITGLVYGLQASSKKAFSQGDSGGPVETTSGSSATIAQGMIEATVVGSEWRGWYMPARTVDSYFNIFVKTS